MTAVMQLARQPDQREAHRPLPPQQITHRAAQDIGIERHPNDPGIVFATIAGHFAYGAFCGAIYGMIAPRRKPILTGAAFGLGVWAASYMGWLPLVGWHAPPHRERPARNAALIASHLTWGAATGLL